MYSYIPLLGYSVTNFSNQVIVRLPLRLLLYMGAITFEEYFLYGQKDREKSQSI